MQTQSPDPRSHTRHKRKQLPWLLGIIVSIAFIIIFAFVVVTLLILRSQGTTQGINTLTILSIIGGFVIAMLSLLVSFLQWHHPKDPSVPKKIVLASSNLSEHSQSPVPLDNQIEKNKALTLVSQAEHRFDWGEAPHVDQLYGRDGEVKLLKQWLVDDHCRLVAILGMGGIGKTGLAATLVDQIHEHYDYVFWRSLYNAPPLESILQECIQFFSLRTDTALPVEIDRQISLLLEAFRSHRCLLILDNAESILQGGSQVGHYREGYEGYGKLIQRIGESKHQNCLLITSREKPSEVALLEGATATRSLQLRGLKLAGGRGILEDKGLRGTEDDWETLITHYGGNPLALKVVAQEIREVFGSTITTFLKDGELFFRDVHDVLEQQMKRLSTREEEIIYWLAIEREAITLSDLQEDIAHPMPKGELQEAVSSLKRRQLIETSAIGATLHPVIMEYLTNSFVDRVSEEIKAEKLKFFEQHTLLKAQAKDYIRESQRRLILQPLLQRLMVNFQEGTLEQQFQNFLTTLRSRHDHYSGYAAGNILNLLIHIGCMLRGYDFSHLVVRQAYLQGIALHGINFAHANLATSVFTESFGNVLSVAFSPQGDLLAAGTATGEILLWHVASGALLQTIEGHTDWVRSVTFNPDGKLLASGGDDQTVRLWEISTGACLNTLQGHTQEVRSVAFSPDGKLLASGSDDQTVRLWEISTGTYLNTLQGHSQEIRSIAFSPDGKTLASGSYDQTVRLWEVSNGKYLTILKGHTEVVYTVAFSPDGKTLASGSYDQTVRLWEVNSGKYLTMLKGHSHWVKSVAFSPDGKTLASGGDDQTVRLWEISTGTCLNTLKGHTGVVRSVVFSPDGKTLVSGGDDQTVRLWEVSSNQCLGILQGYTNAVYSLAFSPDGKTLASANSDETIRLWEVSSGKYPTSLQVYASPVYSVVFSPDGKTLASGSSDETVRLWEVSSSRCIATLRGHTCIVYAVAFSPDGKILASGGDDRIVHLWEVSSGRCFAALQGHTRSVYSLAFSPDGKSLASGNSDETTRLWEVSSGRCIATLQDHTSTVYTVAFSPDGKMLATSSGNEQTVGLWDISSGQYLAALRGHTSTVYAVAFSPDGKTLASGSYDETVRLWDVSSRQCLTTLRGHTHWVRSLAFSPDGKTLASGSYDGAINLWNLLTGTCLKIFRSERLYERMNISHVKGLTETQKASLKLLGAIEDEE